MGHHLVASAAAAQQGQYYNYGIVPIASLMQKQQQQQHNLQQQQQKQYYEFLYSQYLHIYQAQAAVGAAGGWNPQAYPTHQTHAHQSHLQHRAQQQQHQKKQQKQQAASALVTPAHHHRGMLSPIDPSLTRSNISSSASAFNVYNATKLAMVALLFVYIIIYYSSVLHKLKCHDLSRIS